MSTAVLAQDRELQAALPMMEDCLRHAVRRLRTRMLTRSGMDTPWRVVQVRLCAVGELLDEPEVQNGAAWAGFFTERGTASGFAVLEGLLLERLTARLFGDTAAPGADTGLRAATEVELRVATRMCEELFGALEAHWPVRPAPRIAPRPATGNRLGVADGTLSAVVLACTLECGAEDDPLGRLSIALPATMLRGVIGSSEAPSNRMTARRRLNFDRLAACEVELVVELTRLTTTLGDLRLLKVGDAVPLGALGEVRALVNGTPSFAGEPGACDGVRSFRVSRRVIGIEANA